MTLQDTIQQLPDQQFRDLKAWIVTTETDRRAAQPAVEQARAEIVTELQDAGKLEKPETTNREKAVANPSTVAPWVDPGTDHSKMYRYGDVVQHKGYIVESTHHGLNHWEPGELSFDGRIWRIIGTVAELQAATEQPEPEPETTTETETATEPPADKPDTTEWRPGLDAKPGQRYTYKGDTYEVRQPHTTAENWLPNELPALYRKV